MTTLQVTDRLLFDKPKRTSDGYMAVRARAARTGLYDYLASEVGAPADKFKPNDTVKVYRAADEVFDEASMRSFIGRPITDNHPTEAVTADNWKRHSRGTVMAAGRHTATDGDFLAFDLVLMDGDAIRKVDNGKRELSNGYQCQLDWTPGVTPAGEHYDARQTNIRGNHVALVDRGRAGSDCRIGDAVRSDFAAASANIALVNDLLSRSPSKEGRVKLTNLDGLSVNTTDQAATEEALSALDRKVTEANERSANLQTQLDEAKGEKTALEKQLADAKAAADPAALDKRVADRSALVATAAKLVDKIVTDGKTDAEIRRAVVEAKLGDAAKDMQDAEVSGAYRLLAADADKATKANDSKPGGAVPAAITDTKPSGATGVSLRDAALGFRYN